MSGAMSGLIALAGIGIVVVANLLRARRTGDRGCIGHFFVASSEMTVIELMLNRGGIAVFAAGVVGSLVM